MVDFNKMSSHQVFTMLVGRMCARRRGSKDSHTLLPAQDRVSGPASRCQSSRFDLIHGVLGGLKPQLETK